VVEGFDGNLVEGDIESFCHVDGVLKGFAGGEAGGHGEGDNAVGAEGVGGEGEDEGGVDAAAEGDDHFFETGFLDVVVEAELEGLIDFG